MSSREVPVVGRINGAHPAQLPTSPVSTGLLHLKPIARVVRHSLLLSAGLLLAQPALVPQALASPQGGEVAAGQGSIQAPNANTTIINQQSHSLSLNWQSFNLDRPDLVRFNQPSASASVLNRVKSTSASRIMGTIEANGRVFIMNSGGVIFGKNSVVNVGSLFATSLNISTNDFMSGNYNFSALPGQEGGAIVNQGFIQAATGGSVSLVGGSVANEGVIVANLGQVNLAA
ncbi:MAG: filamentous hemagglutinin N-terminal domain-containing protein, partial [Gammaproteobacteria bacterium]|nr:filamentous hemagglutinin N-terminal domain-containing protein [Gammaproteobacteria bacterium]